MICFKASLILKVTWTCVTNKLGEQNFLQALTVC